MARLWRELIEELDQIKRDLAQSGSEAERLRLLRLAALLGEAMDNEQRSHDAFLRALDDLDSRLIAFDNSRFFRILRWPGRFLLDWRGRLGQLLLRSPLHPLYVRLVRPRAVLADYAAWLERERTATMPRQWFVERARQFPYQPSISIILPVYNPRRDWLESALDSVTAQNYPCWELCICDDASAEPWVAEYLAGRAAADPRIRFVRSDRNLGISAASNRAVELGQGEYVGFLDQDDLLSPHALHYVVEAMQQARPDLIYSDEDRLDEQGRRVEPIFKPAWSPDLLLNCMYLGHFLVVRRAAAEDAGWLRSRFDGSQDYDLALRIADSASAIRHIPRVLYHWRRHADSTAANTRAKPYAQAAGLEAVRDTIARRGYDAVCENGALPNTYRVRRRLQGQPKASLVICSRNLHLLRQCVAAIRGRTSYGNYELVIVEHGIAAEMAAVKVPYSGPFNFSDMNNAGAAAAGGEILVFLNDDVEPLAPEWLDELVIQAQRPEVGIAGPRLLYPSGAIQHAGLVIGIMNGVGHLYRDTFGIRHWHWLPFRRNVAAVTGACMAIRKDVFAELGGFDTAFPVNYNDADLCLRARRRGYEVIFEPAALLRHYEGRTRTGGIRYRERELWRARWTDWMDAGDRYYNPNLAHNREDASLELEIVPPRDDNSR